MPRKLPGQTAIKNSVSELETHLGYWLRFVSNHVSYSFTAKIEAEGVTVAEWVLMRQLFKMGTVNPSQLADNLGMTRGAISKLVERLYRKKLLVRSFPAGDRRYQTLALTDSGRALVPVLARLADENDHEFFGHLNLEQRSHLIALLQDIACRQAWKDLPID